ncbi:MAG TPA: hypothetical protein VIT45_08850 [Allosphingosinicella sp.]
MKARVFLAFFLLPAGCGDPDAARKQALADAAEQAGKVDCATDGASSFAPVCTVERTSSAEGLVLTVRSPSGSFRRLLVTRDGRGVVAADGADPANVSLIDGGRIEVAIAGDRYRLPATVKK